MVCLYCGCDMIETTTTYFEELENTIVVIKNVPCNKCDRCDDIVYSESVEERLDKITKQLENNLAEIAIVDYSAV